MNFKVHSSFPKLLWNYLWKQLIVRFRSHCHSYKLHYDCSLFSIVCDHHLHVHTTIEIVWTSASWKYLMENTFFSWKDFDSKLKHDYHSGGKKPVNLSWRTWVSRSQRPTTEKKWRTGWMRESNLWIWERKRKRERTKKIFSFI